LEKAIFLYQIHRKEESLDILGAIFRNIFYDSNKLYTCAISLVRNNLL
jgi:hypothetical protein